MIHQQIENWSVAGAAHEGLRSRPAPALIMTPDTKRALSLKSMAVDFMKERVYRGDFERPTIRQDSEGAFTFKDKRIQITCRPSGREGWMNCTVTVFLLRGSWPFRKLEVVLSTGFGVDVSVFRPGQWADHLSELAETARGIQRDRDSEEESALKEAAQKEHEARFGTVDDSSIFRK